MFPRSVGLLYIDADLERQNLQSEIKISPTSSFDSVTYYCFGTVFQYGHCLNCLLDLLKKTN